MGALVLINFNCLKKIKNETGVRDPARPLLRPSLVGTTLCCNLVTIAFAWSTCIQVAFLQYNHSITENKIDCTIYVTFSIELFATADPQGILVSFDTAIVENG